MRFWLLLAALRGPKQFAGVALFYAVVLGFLFYCFVHGAV